MATCPFKKDVLCEYSYRICLSQRFYDKNLEIVEMRLNIRPLQTVEGLLLLQLQTTKYGEVETSYINRHNISSKYVFMSSSKNIINFVRTASYHDNVHVIIHAQLYLPSAQYTIQ